MRHEYGHAAGPNRSVTRLYWGSRNRLINAARHLPAGSFAKSVVASMGFDVLTLAQLRSGPATKAVARGWLDGTRAMHGERAARTVGGAAKGAAAPDVAARGNRRAAQARTHLAWPAA